MVAAVEVARSRLQVVVGQPLGEEGAEEDDQCLAEGDPSREGAVLPLHKDLER